MRHWDRILVRAVKGLISRAGMVSICPLLSQRDLKLQQTKQQLCTQQCVRANMRIDTQNTPNSARSHYNINTVIRINLITINNASLSHNSIHVRLLQEHTLNNHDFPHHHTRSPPVKAAISHGDHETHIMHALHDEVGRGPGSPWEPGGRHKPIAAM